jgi:hypothetical protein
MSIHTKITIISKPGGPLEDLEEHPSESLVEAFEWITHTLAGRAGVILLRMWFGEQWGGQKTLIRTIGTTEETMHALRMEFTNAWTAWASRRPTAMHMPQQRVRDTACRPRLIAEPV